MARGLKRSNQQWPDLIIPQQKGADSHVAVARQNRTIAIASDFRVDAAKSPEIPQKEGVFWDKLNRGVSKPGCFPLFSGKVQMVSRTLSGLFLVGALNRPRKRKRTNRENPRTIPEQIGKIQKNRESPKKDKKGRTSPDRETSPFSSP